MPPKKSDKKAEVKNKLFGLTDAEHVSEWMNKLDSKMKPGIHTMRKIIKETSSKLNERIKWNAPSYYYKEDLVNFGSARGEDKIILVFHHPNIVKIKSTLLGVTIKIGGWLTLIQ